MVLDAVEKTATIVRKLEIDFAVVESKQKDMRKILWFCFVVIVGLVIERLKG